MSLAENRHWKLKRLAERVGRALEEANLCPGQVAAKSSGRLSRTTLRNLLCGRGWPRRATLDALCSIEELKLNIGELLAILSPKVNSTSRTCVLAYLDYRYDPIGLAREIMDQLTSFLERPQQGRHLHFQPHQLYFEPLSAHHWLAIANDASYLATRNEAPLREAAEEIVKLTRDDLDLIGLGCGDAREEVLLTSHLHRMLRGRPNCLRLHLFDISDPLLVHAHRHASTALHNNGDVEVCQPTRGDFLRLPDYHHLCPPPGGHDRQRLICMFGATFGNLENEIAFVRNSLQVYAPGDLLLLQVSGTYAPAEDEEAIWTRDPRLARQMSDAAIQLEEQWWFSLIEHYAPRPRMQAGGLRVRSLLNPPIHRLPGSYAIESLVEFGTDHRFSMEYIKRYDSDLLAQVMKREGWAPIRLWTGTWLLHLYQRQQRSAGEVALPA